LSYVHKSQYGEWMQFVDTHKDVYWPIVANPSATISQSLLVHQPPHTRPILDPVNALSLELATMVANGRLEPHEATLIKEQGPNAVSEDIDETDAETLEDDESDDDESEYDSDADSDDYDDSEVDDEEMLNEMGAILYKQ
jgi:hypothetical protein